ncbi:glyoxalase [Streptomyces sp. NPDC056600]|uniref:glyoxalase n=1 Tax=Streptomyces sp. NPDC056600 TaxID=3345874 RepID=UPI0036C28528
MTTTASPRSLSLASVTLEVDDVESARRFYDAFGVAEYIRLRASDAPSTGFRGFTLALTVSRPATVDGFLDAAVEAGATVLKPAAKSLWGYGGVVQAPDGTIWKVATSEKKDTGPATREIDDVVVLLGVEDVKASKRFYAEQGLTVARSFGGKYAEFAAGDAFPVKLALYKRPGLAKDLGLPADGDGSHRLALGATGGPFTDPDGFTWETAEASVVTRS